MKHFVTMKSNSIGMLATAIAIFSVSLASCSQPMDSPDDGRKWLAGDHHVHTEFSGGYDTKLDPPAFIATGDGTYPLSLHVENAQKFGLKWLVTTDHGGPLHSIVNRDQAYPKLVETRAAFPNMLLFYGMEFDTPQADHSTLIIPKSNEEAQTLFDIESRFSKLDPWPEDKAGDTEEKMIAALEYMKALPEPPIVIKNHPSRTAPKLGAWGQDTPKEMRSWNDTAPGVMIGFEGAPGHQAASLQEDSSQSTKGVRGAYHYTKTRGGYDPAVAIVGGLWDSLLSEGRRWWMTATSDSHTHYTEGNIDFWPGEYSKTYVKAHEDYKDVIDQLRNGAIFTVTGDLITELDVTAREVKSSWLSFKKLAKPASIGGTLNLTGKGADVTVTIRFRDPLSNNANGANPQVKRVDLIIGEITGKAADPTTASSPTSKVVERFDERTWSQDDDYFTITYTLKDIKSNSYIRVRGTNTDELEPEEDAKGEDPWHDLWFYSNPIFIEAKHK
ncbi:CehA/McbA family metallohydrolase domain-containing protein [Cohnella abietis]|uniref:Polymerase/histidinol phosphatase N-terminal domain-containing protein n=1 Tax=Cohnella abietis TaxID=2507935 RepID=A0A3T1D0I3_9BACL|nr:phosphoesterase [Cohnella abietis]BBI31610.1 hypothetical protein KCTCHS21_10090 [Cohnella abietis]